MPYTIEHRSGSRPWKIVNKETGKVVGSSTSRLSAERSAHARMAAHHGWHPTGSKGKGKE